MENIKKVVKNLKKEIGKEVNIKTISSALTRRGFTLLYTNTDEGIEQLEHHKLTQYAKNKKCFTYISSVKLVFVDGSLNINDIIKLLLHELAHVELRHIGYTDYHIYDEVSAEVEADAVVYSILQNNRTKHIAAAFIIIAILLANIVGIGIFTQRNTATATVAASVKVAKTTSEDFAYTVYVTRTGTRYHKESCRYAKIDGVKALPLEEAAKTHTPCKVCKP